MLLLVGRGRIGLGPESAQFRIPMRAEIDTEANTADNTDLTSAGHHSTRTVKLLVPAVPSAADLSRMEGLPLWLAEHVSS